MQAKAQKFMKKYHKEVEAEITKWLAAGHSIHDLCIDFGPVSIEPTEASSPDIKAYTVKAPYRIREKTEQEKAKRTMDDIIFLEKLALVFRLHLNDYYAKHVTSA